MISLPRISSDQGNGKYSRHFSGLGGGKGLIIRGACVKISTEKKTGCPVLFFGVLFQEALDLVLHEVEGHVVHSAVDDDVRVDPGGLHIEVVHGLYGGEVLIDDVFDLPAPLLGVPQHPSEDPLVCVRIHEDLDVRRRLS